MVYKNFFIIGALFLTFFWAGCSDNDTENIAIHNPIEKEDDKPIDLEPAKTISLSTEGKQGIRLQNDFAVSIFKDIVSESNGDNSLFSPLSLTTCISMLANGASDEAAVEMIEKLMGKDLSLEEFNQNNEFLMNELLEVDPSSTFLMANSAWLHKEYSFHPLFEDNVKKFYNAGTAVLDMYSTNARDIINEWSNKTTKGIIPILFNSAPSSKFVLANSIYFNGGWVAEFDERNTKDKPFSNIDGTVSNVQTMRIENFAFNHYIGEECSAVCLPYGNYAFNFYALLPNENSDFMTFVKNLDIETINKIIDSMNQDYVYIDLPKFEVSSDNNQLQEHLKANGIYKVFNGTNSIAKLANEPFEGNIVCFQKNAFKVTESGAEGASVTGLISIEMGEGGFAPTPEIKLNRPFLYVVAEKSTGAILFIGSVVKL